MSHQGKSDRRLVELAALCRKAKGVGKHPRYGAEVRALVQSLVGDGMKLTEIARGSGISLAGVRKWIKGEAVMPAVRVLKVASAAATVGDQETLLLVRTREFEVAVYRPRGASI